MDFNVVVLGTGLSESITTAALSKAGYKVAHLDANPYYGGDDASLSLDELVSWADERTATSAPSSSYLAAQRKRFTGMSYTGVLPPQSRQYAVSLQPTIIPSIGPLIDSLIASGVSRYGGFKLLERVAIFDEPGIVKPVPGSKEDVFKNKKLSLLHKRRLMRFLLFAGGQFEDKPELQGNEDVPFAEFLAARFSLDAEAVQVIVYALAFCISPSDPTLPALQRVRRYLQSTGRYGASSFLVGHYGGLGEISQGFCRTSAVGGATYILGRQVLSVASSPSEDSASRKYKVRLEDVEEDVQCDVLITGADYADEGTSSQTAGNHSYSFVHCVAVIDRPILFSTSSPDGEQASATVAEESINGEVADQGSEEAAPTTEVDTALLVFPPSSLEGGSSDTSVNVLITGEGSQSTPRGKWLLYITMPLPNGQNGDQAAEELLQPYLHATLSLAARSNEGETASPLFTLFYTRHPPPESTESSSSICTGSPAPYLPEIADSAATNGQATFWKAVEALKAKGITPERKAVGDSAEGDVSETEREVESFWPPLEFVDENEDW